MYLQGETLVNIKIIKIKRMLCSEMNRFSVMLFVNNFVNLKY